jgi:hypothetical protein
LLSLLGLLLDKNKKVAALGLAAALVVVLLYVLMAFC